jgi:predicted enzyme related to lactoylglutathione lyase
MSVLRRATVFVRDIARAKDFYMGVFGLSVYHERVVDLSRVALFPVGPAPRGGAAKFVILKGEDPLVGMVGLMEMTDPPLPDPVHDPRRLGFGSVALVFSVSNAKAVAAAIPPFGGEVIMPVTSARNLGDMQGEFVPVEMLMAYDCDGHFLEIFEPK